MTYHQSCSVHWLGCLSRKVLCSRLLVTSNFFSDNRICRQLSNGSSSRRERSVRYHQRDYSTQLACLKTVIRVLGHAPSSLARSLAREKEFEHLAAKFTKPTKEHLRSNHRSTYGGDFYVLFIYLEEIIKI